MLGDLQQLGVLVERCIGIYTHIRIFEVTASLLHTSICFQLSACVTILLSICLL